MLLVDAIDSLAFQSLLDLRMLGHVTHAKHHGEDQRGGWQGFESAVPAERIKEGIRGGIVALSGRAKDAGGGAGGYKEIEFRVPQSRMKIQRPLDFGSYGCDPVTIRHVLE